MRIVTCLVAVGLAVGTTGCIDVSMPGMGSTPFATSAYGNGFGASPYAMSPYATSPYAMSPYAGNSYYAQPAGNYFYQQPQVFTQTRYVPVPTSQPAPQRTFRRWEGRRNGTVNDQPRTTFRRDRDSDGNGIPDRQERREQRRAHRNG